MGVPIGPRGGAPVALWLRQCVVFAAGVSPPAHLLAGRAERKRGKGGRDIRQEAGAREGAQSHLFDFFFRRLFGRASVDCI